MPLAKQNKNGILMCVSVLDDIKPYENDSQSFAQSTYTCALKHKTSFQGYISRVLSSTTITHRQTIHPYMVRCKMDEKKIFILASFSAIAYGHYLVLACARVVFGYVLYVCVC